MLVKKQVVGGRGHIVFQGGSPVCLPLPGQVIKLSFSTSPKTLSLRLDLGPECRQTELLVAAGA